MVRAYTQVLLYIQGPLKSVKMCLERVYYITRHICLACAACMPYLPSRHLPAQS